MGNFYYGALVLFFQLIVSSALAAPQSREIRIGDSIFKIKSQDGEIWFSEKCFENRKSCEASNVLAKEQKVSCSEVHYFSGNPSAETCNKLGGLIKISVDEKRNEQTFCKFKDGSLVNARALLVKCI